jgi:hypothetical protein
VLVLTSSISHALICCVKCINNQQRQFNFMMYFYLYYVRQHVSASNPTIFRAMCVLRVLNNNYYYQYTNSTRCLLFKRHNILNNNYYYQYTNSTRCLLFKRHNVFLSYFPYQITLTFCIHYATVAALASPRSLP